MKKLVFAISLLVTVTGCQPIKYQNDYSYDYGHSTVVISSIGFPVNKNGALNIGKGSNLPAMYKLQGGQKGKYETTEEFNSRQKNISGKMVSIILGSSFKYDPDVGKLTFYGVLLKQRDFYYETKEDPFKTKSFELSLGSKASKSWNSTMHNGFGAEVDVSHFEGERYAVLMDHVSLSSTAQTASLNASFAMDREYVKNNEKNLAIKAYGISNGGIGVYHEHSYPTYDSPYEVNADVYYVRMKPEKVVVVNKVTGEEFEGFASVEAY